MKRNSACRGITAENFFKDLKVDKSYCGADSIDVEIGISSVDFDPRTESAVCRSGAECYILADSTKFSIRPFIDKVIDIHEINHVISDGSLDMAHQNALRDAGIDVIIASCQSFRSDKKPENFLEILWLVSFCPKYVAIKPILMPYPACPKGEAGCRCPFRVPFYSRCSPMQHLPSAYRQPHRQ